jgi:thioredoxin:protein disulfide reductase
MAASLYPEGHTSARRRAVGHRRIALTIAGAVLLLIHAGSAFAAAPAVTASWRTSGTSSAAGAPVDLQLVVTLEGGWHVNAHDPTQPYLIPTALEVDVPAGATIDAIHYPEAVVRKLAFAPDTALRLYEGTFTIGVRLAGAKPARFDARLSYQACNAERCLPPRTLPVPFAAEAAAAAKGTR